MKSHVKKNIIAWTREEIERERHSKQPDERRIAHLEGNLNVLRGK